MLEGMIPSLYRATKKVVVVLAIFIAGANFSFAAQLGGGGADSGQAGQAADSVITSSPRPLPKPTINNNSNTGSSNVGSETGSSGSAADSNAAADGGAPPAEPATQLTACDGFFNTINCFVVNFFGSFVAIAGYAFDVSIRWFIVGFGELYRETGLGHTVESTWTTVRDVFNLTFIFGLVYIGFQIILGINDSSAKRTIPMLIIAALFVNFSMFIVKFIIDFANIAALQIYNLFKLSTDIQKTTTEITESSNVASILTEGGPSISLAFINALGVTTLLGYLPQTEQFLYLFGLIIIFGVLIYVFLAGAIMVTIRFAVLIFYIIFSPVMFLGWVFPGFQSYTSNFWKGLIGQAFFAPAFIFMLYISLSLITGFNDANIEGAKGILRNDVSSIGDKSTLAGGDALHTSSGLVKNMASIVPFLILTVVFILASLVVARRIASASGSMVVKASDWAINKTRAGLNSSLYPLKAAPRVAVNKAGDGIEKRLNSLQTRGGALGWIASTNTADRILRGAAQKAQKAQLGTHTTNKDEKEYREATRRRSNQTQADKSNDEKFNDSLIKLQDTAQGATALDKAFKDLSDSISSLTEDKLVKLGVDKLKDQSVAVHLSDAQIESLSKSGKYSNSQVAEIKTAKKEAMKSIAAGTYIKNNPSYNASSQNDFRQRMISKVNVQDAAKLPTEVFTQSEMYEFITPKMLENKIRAGGLSTKDLNSMKSALVSNTNAYNKNAWIKWRTDTVDGALFFS